MLWIFAEAVGVSVRKHVRPVMVCDGAVFAARISRQTSMSTRIEIPRHNLITDGEAGLLTNLSSHRLTGSQNAGNTFSEGRVLAARHRETWIGCELQDLRFDFIASQRAGLQDRVLHRGEPTFIIARR